MPVLVVPASGHFPGSTLWGGWDLLKIWPSLWHDYEGKSALRKLYELTNSNRLAYLYAWLFPGHLPPPRRGPPATGGPTKRPGPPATDGRTKTPERVVPVGSTGHSIDVCIPDRGGDFDVRCTTKMLMAIYYWATCSHRLTARAKVCNGQPRQTGMNFQNTQSFKKVPNI